MESSKSCSCHKFDFYRELSEYYIKCLEKYKRVLYEVCLEYCSPDLPDDDETYEYGYAPLSSKGKEVLAHVMEALGIEEGDPEYFAQSPLGYYDIP